MNGQNVQPDEAWSKVSKSMEDAVKTLEQVVDDNKEAFQEILWGAFINWAIREPEMWESYARDTGKRNPFPQGELEKAIDRACGYAPLGNESLCHDFIKWATENVYGVTFTPQKILEKLGLTAISNPAL